jgi:hypothetical protein
MIPQLGKTPLPTVSYSITSCPRVKGESVSTVTFSKRTSQRLPPADANTAQSNSGNAISLSSVSQTANAHSVFASCGVKATPATVFKSTASFSVLICSAI